MNFLRPVEIKERYLRLLASSLRNFFSVSIFNNIFAILNGEIFVLNDSNEILIALRTGQIFYEDGFFKTDKKFSNKIALELEKLGAVYKKSGYAIKLEDLPPNIQSEISILKVEAATKLNSIDSFLTALQLADVVPFVDGLVKQMFDSFCNDLTKSLEEKNIPVIELPIDNPNIEIPEKQALEISKYWEEKEKEAAQLRASYEFQKQNGDKESIKRAQKTLREFQKQKYKNAPKFDYTFPGNPTSRQVAENYTYNLKYWVKNWSTQDIAKMREDIVEMVKKGVRIGEIRKYFEKRWKIAGDKAEFLARNEAGLASTAIKEWQYKQAGCTHFKWLPSTVKEKNRRKLHEKYYNEIFSFDNPPLIDERLDIYGLPKQVWNCSCGIMPVVPKIEVKNDRSIFKRYKIRNIEYRRFTERKEV